MRTTTAGPIRIDAPPLRYEPALDGIRALAVLIVMFYHFGGDQWFHGGVITVDWFFVLSGFLITNLLLDERHREGAVSLKGFYHRRILRLFPAMYAFLGFMLLASPLLIAKFPDIYVEIGSAAAYSYNLLLGLFGFGDRALLHLWTLSVEEWFYFFWPMALIWGISRARSQRVLLVASAIFIAFWMGLRLWAGVRGIDLYTPKDVNAQPYAIAVLLRFSIMRFDVLVMGCLIAIVRRRIVPLTPDARRWVGRAAGVGTALILGELLLAGRLAFFEPFSSVGYNLALFGVAVCALWLHFNPQTKVGRFMSIPFLVYVGKRSYGLYLWHEVPNAIVPQVKGTIGYGLRTAVVFGLSFALAELSWRLVESPFLRRKHKRYANVSGR